MKEVLLQELIDLVNVMDPNFTLLEMLDPEAARVLEISRKIKFYLTAVHLTCKSTWRAQVTNISLEIAGHEPQAALR